MGPSNDEKDIYPMVDILNLALPYFGLIFIGFACGKAKGLPHRRDVAHPDRPAGVSVRSK